MDNILIGTDVEEISRFKNKIIPENYNFLKKIFTEQELHYCFSKKDPAPSLTARFAGKEAVIKALSNIHEDILLNQIEILNDLNNLPRVNILCKNLTNLTIHISLSHSKEIAIAFVLIVSK